MAKILFLTDSFYPEIGGIITVSEILAETFTEKGHEIHLATWSTNFESEDSSKFSFKVLRAPTKLQLIKEFQWAEVIFENNPCLRLSWLNRFFKKPHVISLHTWISRADGKLIRKDKFKLSWLSRADRVIACSRAIKNKCFDDAIVIENSYDDKVFKRFPDVDKTKDFVFLGRLVSDKGADVLIQAFHQFLIRNKGNYILTIIGDGPERNNLETMISNLEIKDKVIFTGSLRGKSLNHLLNQHRFIIVPSVWEEPFGIVALEGMACGCLPIVSDGGGLADAVGNAGLVFERGNVNSLVMAMNSIINDSVLENQLRDNIKNHLKKHSVDFVTKQYLDVIESVIRL